MDELTYVVSYRFGSVEIVPGAPGYSRAITRDENGVVIKDVSEHFVCMMVDGACCFCGREQFK